MLLLVAILGLLVGSFVNAVVWRIHMRSTINEKRLTKRSTFDVQRLSILKGRSMCPACKHQLAPIDLVPVFSWLFLRGKCRYCQKPISAQYPIVELLTALLFAVVFLVLGGASNNMGAASAFVYGSNEVRTILELIFWFYIISVFMILSVYDLRWMLLPDVVLLPAIVISFVFFGTQTLFGLPTSVFVAHILAALGAGALFYSLAVITRGKGMGGEILSWWCLLDYCLGLKKLLLPCFWPSFPALQ